MSYWSEDYTWAPRKTAAQRRAEAEREIKDAARRGRAKSPVAIAGRKIACTFWGKSWCDNLERYRDFAYRLERGRSYLRSGSVIDLQIQSGKIAAEVLGSRLYKVAIEIDAVQRAAWRAIQRDCAGAIGSRLELLSGRLSEPVMARLCAERTGLFPAPSAIRFTCSCPDYATMCKHVAATMYGVGARLDHAPDMLFILRRVSLDELLASAVTELPANPASGRVLAAEGLASLFGIELADAPPAATSAPGTRGRARPSPTSAARREAAAVVDTATATKAKPTRRTGAKVRASSPARAKARRLLTPVVARIAKKVGELSSTRTTRGNKTAPSARRSAPPTKPGSPGDRRSR